MDGTASLRNPRWTRTARAALLIMVTTAVIVVPGWLTRSASAHSCMTVQSARVGVPTTVEVAVTAEWWPVTAVEVVVPHGFELDDVPLVPPWRSELRGSTVHFAGGSVPRQGCGSLPVSGTATREGRLVFSVTVFNDAGDAERYANDHPLDHFAGQVLEVTDTTGSGHRQVLLTATAAALAAVVVALVIRRNAR